MRGKGLRLFVYSAFLRITPAYAGKSDIRTHFRRSTRDHPRVCGEKWIRRDEPLASEGSPPHMRGKGFRFLAVFLRFRITPAYAGKRTTMNKSQFTKRDHPRICGEKLAMLLLPVQFLGSPPHMRGKAHVPAGNRTSVGITPAYAGKSINISPQWNYCQDHPRICGEKTKKIP